MYTAAYAPSVGIMADNRKCFAIARAAFLRGNVGQFDIANSDASSTDNLVGSLTSGLVNVIAPAAGGISSGIVCLFLQDAAVGQRVKVLLRGRDSALCIKSAGNISRGDRLVATTAKNLSPDHSAGDRIIARAVDAATAPSSATLIEVDFDGINGLGVYTS